MSMPKLDVRHLQLVRAIAEEGSVTRAGLRLHLTQSALSHQLRDAEQRLGVRLFERVGRRLLLAPAGERLLRSARTVLEELERAEEEVGRKGAILFVNDSKATNVDAGADQLRRDFKRARGGFWILK